MKKIASIVCLLVYSTMVQAGYIIASDSSENGVLRVSRDVNTEVIKLEKCETIKYKCELINSRSNFSINVSLLFNHIHTAAAAFGHVIPAAIGAGLAISSIGWYGAGTVALDVATGAVISYGGTKLITIPKSLNVRRLYDYSSIYFDDFLEDESSFVALPDDTIAEIANELL